MHPTLQQDEIVRRVRAILLTPNQTLMFIKRVKPDGRPPYWVAPGGGVEDVDATLMDTLHRELGEELGATIQVMSKAFVLEHSKAGKNLEEHFYICRLLEYDLTLRNGPEFSDPAKGEYIPFEVELTPEAINAINIKTLELQDWLLNNLNRLHYIA